MTNSKPSLTAMAKALAEPKEVDPTTQLGVLGPAPGFDANGNTVDAFSPAILKAGEMPDIPADLKRTDAPETIKAKRERLVKAAGERKIKDPPSRTAGKSSFSRPKSIEPAGKALQRDLEKADAKKTAERIQRLRETTKPAALTPAKEETTKMPTSKTTKSSARTSVKAKTTATDQPTKAQKAAAVIKADPEASAAVKTARRKAKAAPAPAPAEKAPAKAKAVKLPAGKSKSDIVEEMLRSPKGATRKELSEASGWPYVNLKMAAIRAGMELVQKGDHFRLVKTRGESNAAA